METENYHSKLFSTAITSILVIIFVIGAAIGINYIRTRNEGAAVNQQNTAPSAKTGSMKLITQAGEIAAANEFLVTVSAHSYDNSVVGFDIDMLLPAGMQFIRAESLHPDFEIKSSVLAGRLLVTGFKKIQVVGSTQFIDTPIVELTLMATKPGTFTLTPRTSPNTKNQSNLI